MQAAAIASALVEREEAMLYRGQLRRWLDRIDSAEGGVIGDMEEGRRFAEFLTDLARVGSGLPTMDL